MGSLYRRYLDRQVKEARPAIKVDPIDVKNLVPPTFNQINQIEAALSEKEHAIRELNDSDSTMRRQLNEMREFQYVIQKVEVFFQVHLEIEASRTIEEAERNSVGDPLAEIPLLDLPPKTPTSPTSPTFENGHEENKESAWFISGVVPADKKLSFERVLWRACRRTAFVRMADINYSFIDPRTEMPIEKVVFIVFFKGESLKLIVEKVCEGFAAREYPCPKSSRDRQAALLDTSTRILDLEVIIHRTEDHKYQILTEISTLLPEWKKQVLLYKAVFHTLNNFTLDTNGFLAAECWVPEKELDAVRSAMEKGVERTGGNVAPILNVLESARSPPTYHRVNKFTRVFQSIVDGYGVASYREVNPAPYTIITFPFLFAIMFGDFGHGILLLLSGLYLVINERKIIKRRITDEIFNTFFGGRYLILLMGLFSIYAGLIYNDGFAKSVNIFGSSWSNPYNATTLDEVESGGASKKILEFYPDQSYSRERGPYPFGVDPIWNVAENKLNFLNSMKMKVSVIVGVAQMTFGVMLSLFNHCHNRSIVDVLFNFFPQLIFLTSIFIYLCVQIIVKWIYFTYEPGFVFGMEYEGAKCAPSLLIGLINMFMMKQRNVGPSTMPNQTLSNCYLHFWYPHQANVEFALLMLALGCIPIMLFTKPLIQVLGRKGKDMKKRRSEMELLLEEPQSLRIKELAPIREAQEKEAKKETHDNTDVIVHQAIHTIEFVLGCVSHTASYLRLWALSLAHAQLSEVLWHMVFVSGINGTGNSHLAPILAYVFFFVFALLTFSVLVLMEGLSAFLHALRLHWVEFQSKFYIGTGQPFQPFSLVQCIEQVSPVTEEIAQE
ncbi:unnamed protein product, partial [Mesorhabditis spiculigera]